MSKKKVSFFGILADFSRILTFDYAIGLFEGTLSSAACCEVIATWFSSPCICESVSEQNAFIGNSPLPHIICL
jgi:hypothetical protein